MPRHPTRRLALVATLAIQVGLASITQPQHAHACSFGVLDRVSVGDSLQDVMDTLYNGCGGSVNVTRDCLGGCDASERLHGKRFLICSDAGRDGSPTCVTLQAGKVVSIRRDDP